MTFTRIKEEDIKVGDIHYETAYGRCIECEVLTKPELDDGKWRWTARHTTSAPAWN